VRILVRREPIPKLGGKDGTMEQEKKVLNPNEDAVRRAELRLRAAPRRAPRTAAFDLFKCLKVLKNGERKNSYRKEQGKEEACDIAKKAPARRSTERDIARSIMRTKVLLKKGGKEEDPPAPGRVREKRDSLVNRKLKEGKKSSTRRKAPPKEFEGNRPAVAIQRVPSNAMERG